MIDPPTISEQDHTAEELVGALAADAGAAWLERCGGDGMAALLCATAAAAEQHAVDVAHRTGYSPDVSTADLDTARRLRDAAQLDIVQYYGPALAEQHPDVRRAAGHHA